MSDIEQAMATIGTWLPRTPQQIEDDRRWDELRTSVYTEAIRKGVERRQERTLHGLPVRIDPTIPDNAVVLEQDGKVVGSFTLPPPDAP